MKNNEESSSIRTYQRELNAKFLSQVIEEKIEQNRIIIAMVAFLYILPLFTNSELSATRATISLLTNFLIFVSIFVSIFIYFYPFSLYDDFQRLNYTTTLGTRLVPCPCFLRAFFAKVSARLFGAHPFSKIE